MAEHIFKILNTARFLNYVWPFFNIMHEKLITKTYDISDQGETFKMVSVLFYYS